MPPEFFQEEGPSWIKKQATNRQPWKFELSIAEIFLPTIWTIWKERNSLAFEGRRKPPRIAAANVAKEVVAAYSHLNAQLKVPIAESEWSPPPPSAFKLNTDGSATKSNAAAGGLIRNSDGAWIGGFAMNIGPSSAMDAELWGLRQGLFLALQLDISSLIVELDALEIVRTLDTGTLPPNPAPTLLHDCYGLTRKFKSFKIQYAPRDANTAADRLANLGHDLPHGVTSFRETRCELVDILGNDISGHVP